MIYAPMVIPTLCRADHFIQCVESLKKNTWAKYTEIYIALDYPAEEKHWEGYNKICEYLNGEFAEFADFIVIKRNHNFGAFENTKDAYDQVWRKYDRFIRCDDDCVFSENFLEYMDKCLELYKDREDILAVTGYSYPVNWKIKPYCNAFLGQQIFPMWGTGFWRDKYIAFRKEILDGFIKNFVVNEKISLKQMTTARYVNAVNGALTLNSKDFTKTATDVACGIYLQLNQKFIVTPLKTKVKNIGFDGSGLSCGKTKETKYKLSKKIRAKNYQYANQKIDKEKNFIPAVDENVNFYINKKILDDFDYTPLYVILKAKIKLLSYRLVGEKRFNVFIRKKNNCMALFKQR